jgi:hypothetical protein
LSIAKCPVPSVQPRPRHEAPSPSRLRPPQRSRVAGAQKYKYNTNTYNTKYTPPSGVFSFPACRQYTYTPFNRHRLRACLWARACWGGGCGAGWQWVMANGWVHRSRSAVCGLAAGGPPHTTARTTHTHTTRYMSFARHHPARPRAAIHHVTCMLHAACHVGHFTYMSAPVKRQACRKAKAATKRVIAGRTNNGGKR